MSGTVPRMGKVAAEHIEFLASGAWVLKLALLLTGTDAVFIEPGQRQISGPAAGTDGHSVARAVCVLCGASAPVSGGGANRILTLWVSELRLRKINLSQIAELLSGI